MFGSRYEGSNHVGQYLRLIVDTEGMPMKFSYAAPLAAAILIVLFPLNTYSAESDTTSLSAEELSNISKRIRETGAQMKEDLKHARARMEARKAQEEADRKHEAELAHQRAIQEEKQRQAQEAAQARARQEAAARAAPAW
jgi:Skp family chaperone for outer membrane proteins